MPQSYEDSVVELLPDDLRVVHQRVGAALCIASLYLNGALAVLLVTERSRVLAEYRRVLLVQCIVDIACTLITTVTAMYGEMVKGQLLMLANGPLRWAPMGWQYGSLFLYVTALHSSMFVAPLVFIFRYMHLIREYTMSSWQIVGFAAFVVATGSLQGGGIVGAALANSGPTRAAACRQMLGGYEIWTRGHIDDCIVTASVDDSVMMMYVMSFVSLLNIAAYVTMTFCTIRIVQRTRRMRAKMVQATASVHNQINRLLIVQWFLPLIFSALPLIGVITVPMIVRGRVPGLGIVSSLCFSALPMCSPLTTILSVANFRRRFAWRMTPLRWAPHPPADVSAQRTTTSGPRHPTEPIAPVAAP